jgi:PIN domain nuclease of toxin-antitoxin system
VRVLLDTHAFLWFVTDAASLSPSATAAIAAAANTPLLSIASVWEMAIKAGNRKLKLDGSVEAFVARHIPGNAFDLLPIDVGHVARVETLPLLHRDPFDRLLAAQALIEDLPLVSADTMFDAYGVRRIW